MPSNAALTMQCNVAEVPSIVYLPGSWDLLHPGHIAAINLAAQYGSKLIVGVESDELVVASKGRAPIMGEQERALLVGSLKKVAQTIIYRDHDYISLLQKLRAGTFCLSDQCREVRHQKAVAAAEKAGIRVVRIPYSQGFSSVQIKAKIREAR